MLRGPTPNVILLNVENLQVDVARGDFIYLLFMYIFFLFPHVWRGICERKSETSAKYSLAHSQLLVCETTNNCQNRGWRFTLRILFSVLEHIFLNVMEKTADVMKRLRKCKDSAFRYYGKVSECWTC